MLGHLKTVVNEPCSPSQPIITLVLAQRSCDTQQVETIAKGDLLIDGDRQVCKLKLIGVGEKKKKMFSSLCFLYH